MSFQLLSPSPPPISSTSSLPSAAAAEESSGSQSVTLPGGAIAGIVIGASLLIGLIVGAFVLIRKLRRLKAELLLNNPNTDWMRVPSTWGEPQPLVTMGSVNRIPYMTPNAEDGSSDRNVSFASPARLPWDRGDVTQNEYSRPGPPNTSLRKPITRPAGPRPSHSWRATDASPPNYSGSKALADWANANRNSISPDVEACLARVGYQPDDGPDILTEEEWAEYGVTKIQLKRIRAIYVK